MNYKNNTEDFKPSFTQKYQFVFLDIVFGAYLIIALIGFFGCFFK